MGSESMQQGLPVFLRGVRPSGKQQADGKRERERETGHARLPEQRTCLRNPARAGRSIVHAEGQARLEWSATPQSCTQLEKYRSTPFGPATIRAQPDASAVRCC